MKYRYELTTVKRVMRPKIIQLPILFDRALTPVIMLLAITIIILAQKVKCLVNLINNNLSFQKNYAKKRANRL